MASVPLRPQAQFSVSPCSIAWVFRANVIWSGLMSGVIRPMRSSGPEQLREQFLDRAVDVVRASNADVAGVEEDDEHAPARVRSERVSLGRRLRLDAFVLGAARGDDDVLEGVDLLRAPSSVTWKSAAVEVLDRHTVMGRIHVDPDEVRSGLELGGAGCGVACCWDWRRPGRPRRPGRGRESAAPATRRMRVDTSDLRGKLAGQSTAVPVSGRINPPWRAREACRTSRARGGGRRRCAPTRSRAAAPETAR